MTGGRTLGDHPVEKARFAFPRQCIEIDCPTPRRRVGVEIGHADAVDDVAEFDAAGQQDAVLKQLADAIDEAVVGGKQRDHRRRPLEHGSQPCDPAIRLPHGPGDLQHGDDVGDCQLCRRLADEADDTTRRLRRHWRRNTQIRWRTMLAALLLRTGLLGSTCLRAHQPEERRPVGLVVAGKQTGVEDRQVVDDDQPRRDRVLDAKQHARVNCSGDSPCRFTPLEAMQEGTCQAVHRRASRVEEAA